jgi:FkbM family methyltransferase
MLGVFDKSSFQLFKKTYQYKFEQFSQRRAFFFQKSRHGIEDVLDMSPWFSPNDAILDVGANVGQSAIRFRAIFPKARIICFEPVASTFAELQKNTRRLGVEAHKLALGSETKSQTMFLTHFSTSSSLLKPPEDELRDTEQVEVVTLDQFVKEHSLDYIGLLKIDAEGFDLEVINGAAEMLSSGRVRFVMVEVGFHPGDDRHPLFDEVRNTLMKYGFHVFGIYNQGLEWTGEPSLRFANILFCRGAESRPSQ